MSPRRNRDPRRRPAAVEPLDDERARRGVEAVQTWTDDEWIVRTVPGTAAVKAYRCPGCDQEIRTGVAHVVAWHAEPLFGEGPEDRRHWHTGCWRARGRRTPNLRRSG